MFKTLIFLFAIVVSFHAKLLGQQEGAYIKAGFLYDSKNNKLLKDKLIHIQGNKIVSIDEFETLPKNSQVIDLSKYTVLPGLIDAHTHVLFSQDPDEDFAEHSVHSLTMESDALRVLRGYKRAKCYRHPTIQYIYFCRSAKKGK